MSGAEIDFDKLGDDASLYASDELASALHCVVAMLKSMTKDQREVFKECGPAVVGFALLAQVDALSQEIRLNRLHARDTPQASDSEKSIMYRALEANCLFGIDRPSSVKEMEERLARFKKLVGL